MEVGDRDLSAATLAFRHHHGIERNEGNSEIRGMRGNAMSAAAQHGMQPVLAMKRAAPAAGMAAAHSALVADDDVWETIKWIAGIVQGVALDGVSVMRVIDGDLVALTDTLD